MSEIRNENDPELIMMGYVIRDEDTDEIIGIRDDAPDDVKAFFKEYMNQSDDEPVVRQEAHNGKKDPRAAREGQDRQAPRRAL